MAAQGRRGSTAARGCGGNNVHGGEGGEGGRGENWTRVI